MQLRQGAGFREYLQHKGLSRLIGDAFSVCAVIVAGQLLSKAGPYFPSLVVLAPLVRDPFTVLATLVVVASYTDLDFMEFRLRAAGLTDTHDLDPLSKQRSIPKLYKEAFGSDVFMRGWSLRLTFLLLFFIAALRWALSWKR